jgi:hypothetical protein
MKVNIKKLSTEELTKIRKAVANFEPYSVSPIATIFSISEIGKIIRMFKDMIRGHKTLASGYFSKLLPSSKSKLPTWVIDYFIKDDDCMGYEEWRAFGRQVKLGQTFVSRSLSGKPLFAKSQTIVRFSESKPKNATGKETQSTFSKA